MHSFVTSNALPLGYEHSTGCLWEGPGQRQQREPEQRSFLWGDKDKTPFSWRKKSEIFKECKQVNFVGNSGKLLKEARFSLPYNISKFFCGLSAFDGRRCFVMPDPPVKGQRAWSHMQTCDTESHNKTLPPRCSTMGSDQKTGQLISKCLHFKFKL